MEILAITVYLFMLLMYILNIKIYLYHTFWYFFVVSLYRCFKRIIKTLFYLLITIYELKTNILPPIIRKDLKLCAVENL